MGKRKETKIPAMTKAEAREIEQIKTMVDIHLQGLRESVASLKELSLKKTTSKDLKEFNKWLYDSKLFLLESTDGEANSIIDELEFTFEDIFSDFEERQNYQRVYCGHLRRTGYDYIDKGELSIIGVAECQNCGAWLWSTYETCPDCQTVNSKKIIPFPMDRVVELEDDFADLKPFEKDGLTIDPMLLSFEEVAKILSKKD